MDSGTKGSGSKFFSMVKKNCNAQGKGKEIYPDGMVFEGNFVEDSKEGPCAYTDSDGNIYSGEFSNNIENGGKRSSKFNFLGQGKMVYSNGGTYEGG